MCRKQVKAVIFSQRRILECAKLASLSLNLQKIVILAYRIWAVTSVRGEGQWPCVPQVRVRLKRSARMAVMSKPKASSEGRTSWGWRQGSPSGRVHVCPGQWWHRAMVANERPPSVCSFSMSIFSRRRRSGSKIWSASEIGVSVRGRVMVVAMISASVSYTHLRAHETGT